MSFALMRPLSKLLRLTLTGLGLSVPLMAQKNSSEVKAEVTEGCWSYESGGRRIRVETFLPAGHDKRPAVLVLYGSGGALLGKAEMVKVARQLAENGMAAFLVHYFNRTGTLAARDPSINKHWPAWLETVRDGVDAVAAHPRVNPGAIGMFGYSLGAFLAVSESTTDARVDAVAEVAGGLFGGVAGRARRFPKVLILHGREDERVPMRGNVAQFQDLAARFHVEPQVKIYEGQGHSFTRDFASDARARAVAFLQQALGGSGKRRE